MTQGQAGYRKYPPAGGTTGQVLTKLSDADWDYGWEDGGGGGGGTWTEIEINFGSTPVYDAQFTITDASITSASQVAVVPCGEAATGRVTGDWEWDGATIAALPGSGSAVCSISFSPGPVVGARKFLYQVGA